MTTPRRSPALLLALTLLVMLAQTIAAAADVATPQAKHIPARLATDDPGNTGRQPGPAPAGALEERWSLSPVSKYTAVFSGDKLFLNSDWDVGATYAYSAITGDMVWRTETGLPNYSLPVAAEGGVFVSSTTGLWSLDAETGAVLWFIENSDPENLSYSITPLVAADGVLYADLGDRWIAVDALTGVEIWQRAPRYAHSVVLWQDRLFAATGIPQAMIVLDADTGLESGRIPIEFSSDDTPELAVDGSGLYLSSAGSVSAFDLEDLQRRWSVEMVGAISGPTIGDGAVFVSDLDGLHALDAETGVELWMLAGAEPTRPLIAGTTVYVVIGGKLTAVSERDGSVNWTYPTTGTLEAIANGLIYIGPRWVSGNTSAIGGNQLVHATPEAAWAAAASPEAEPATPVASPAATVDDEALASPGVPMFRVNSARGGVNPGPMPEGLPTQLWRTDIGENELLVSSPIVWGDTVFAGGATALYAMDVATGQIRWKYAYQGNGQRSDAVIVPGGVLMWEPFGVRLLDLASGRILWENGSLFNTPTSITVADDVAYIGAYDWSLKAKVFAIDVQAGVVLWNIELPDGQAQAPAAVSNGVLYLTTFDLAGGTYDGSLYALDAVTGSVLWTREHLNSLVSPVIAGELLYVAEFEGSLFAIDTTSGETRWRRELPGRAGSSILVAGSIAYAASGNGALFAFDANSGAHLWNVQTTGPIWLSSPSLAGNTLVAGTSENLLLALDASDGRELWRFEAGGQIRSTPSIVDGRIFFQSDDGYLYALGSAGGAAGQPVAAAPPVPTEEEVPEPSLELSAEFGVTFQPGDFWHIASSEEGVAVLVGGGSTLTLRVGPDSGFGASACVTGARLNRAFLASATETTRLQSTGTSDAPTASANRASGAWEVQEFFDPDRGALQIDCRILETMPGSRFTAVAYTPLIELAEDAPMIEMLLESVAIEPPRSLPGSPASEAAAGSPDSEYAVTVIGPAMAGSTSLPSINDQGQIVASIVDADTLAPHAFIVNGDAVTYLSDDDYAGSVAASLNEWGEVAGTVLGEDGLPHAALWSGGNVTLLPTDGQAPSMTWTINDDGTIAGAIALSSGLRTGAVWTGEAFEVLSEPGIWTDANDLNASGTIVGWGTRYVGSNQAISWSGGEVIALESPEDGASNAQHVNDAGLIAGAITLPDGSDHGAVWIDGKLTDLGTLVGDNSDVTDLNEAGQVLGDSDTGDGVEHSFLWSDGTMIDLGLFGGSPINGVDLNDAGQVAGWAAAEDGRYHALVWHDGVVTDLGTGGGVQAWAHSVNNLGQIAGIVEMEDGTRQIVRWDPESPLEPLPASSPAAPLVPDPAVTPAPDLPEGTFLVITRDIYFEPAEFTIPADTNVTVRLINEGAAPHSFVFEKLPISVDLAPGESIDIVINAPAGLYQYHCHVPGHKEAGMMGTLVVR